MFYEYDIVQHELKIKHLYFKESDWYWKDNCVITMIPEDVEIDAKVARRFANQTQEYFDARQKTEAFYAINRRATIEANESGNPLLTLALIRGALQFDLKSREPEYIYLGYIRHQNSLYAYYSEGDENLIKLDVSQEQLGKFDETFNPTLNLARLLSRDERQEIKNMIGSDISSSDMKNSYYNDHTYTIHLPSYIKTTSRAFPILMNNIKKSISDKEKVEFDEYRMGERSDIDYYKVTPLEQCVIDGIVQFEIEQYKSNLLQNAFSSEFKDKSRVNTLDEESAFTI